MTSSPITFNLTTGTETADGPFVQKVLDHPTKGLWLSPSRGEQAFMATRDDHSHLNIWSVQGTVLTLLDTDSSVEMWEADWTDWIQGESEYFTACIYSKIVDPWGAYEINAVVCTESKKIFHRQLQIRNKFVDASQHYYPDNSAQNIIDAEKQRAEDVARQHERERERDQHDQEVSIIDTERVNSFPKFAPYFGSHVKCYTRPTLQGLPHIEVYVSASQHSSSSTPTGLVAVFQVTNFTEKEFALSSQIWEIQDVQLPPQNSVGLLGTFGWMVAPYDGGLMIGNPTVEGGIDGCNSPGGYVQRYAVDSAPTRGIYTYTQPLGPWGCGNGTNRPKGRYLSDLPVWGGFGAGVMVASDHVWIQSTADNKVWVAPADADRADHATDYKTLDLAPLISSPPPFVELGTRQQRWAPKFIKPVAGEPNHWIANFDAARAGTTATLAYFKWNIRDESDHGAVLGLTGTSAMVTTLATLQRGTKTYVLVPSASGILVLSKTVATP